MSEALPAGAGLPLSKGSPARGLAVSIGQSSDKGRKEINQDFHGVLIPRGPALASKGMVIALADGIGTSPVSHIAAESAIKSLVTDYYCTSDTWSVKTAAQRVKTARDLLNSATQSQEVAAERYRAGVGSILDLLVAQSAYANALAQETQARSDWFVALAMLAHDTGSLGPPPATTAPVPTPTQSGGTP